MTVIVPTRNERDNVAPLVARLADVLPSGDAEVLFVDDSDDGTDAVIRQVAASAPLPVSVIHRTPGDRSGGLGGAVVTGMRAASGRIAVVMDGDLQHPPETIGRMVAPIEAGDAEIVVASRYRDDGDNGGLANGARVGVSRAATRLAKAAFPRRLADCTDPMSGFFAVRLSSVDVERLHPMGFKIFLETVARCGLSVDEVGFTFADRNAGESKANLTEGVRFAGHLARLRLGTLGTPGLRRAFGFGVVGATGLVVNAIAFWLLVRFAHLGYLLAAVVATQVSTTWNFAGLELFVFRGRASGAGWRRYLRFSVLNNTVMLARLPFLALLVEVVRVPQVAANVITLIAVFLVRFFVSDKVIYREESAMGDSGGSIERHGPIDIEVTGRPVGQGRRRRAEAVSYRHFYDLHGIVTIGSDVALPELGFFEQARGARDGSRPDISVRVGRLDGLRRRTRLVQSVDRRSIRWEEHLGRLSANFAIHFGDQIQVTSSRALARSPHVLYTNVIEALLRFVFVDRGYMLLHAACMELDGHGMILSARTDTGKTGTVLKLLRESRGRFLSDDMTIIDAAGTARCFPKPLTISQHTLRAVDAGDLRRREWLWLRVQSRLHSKEGRGFAMRLAEANVPIMTINGWVQRLIPPPKYFVQRLVPCDLTASTQLRSIFIIERGVPHQSPVRHADAVAELLENTEDAYGFPPYRYVAPVLSVGGATYDQLREQERLILISALESVEITRLGSDDFSWAARITDELADRDPAGADDAEALGSMIESIHVEAEEALRTGTD